MQVSADWVHIWTADKAEEELAPFTFHGPGLYLYKTSTLVVVPVNSADKPFVCSNASDNVWSFHCYNCPFAETVFAHIMPVRVDDR